MIEENKTNNLKSNEKNMTFTAHLEELRQAIIISVIALALSTIFCFMFNKQILDFLTEPLTSTIKNVQIVFVSPAEAFMATLRSSLIIGLILALPIILNRIFWFVSPGLTKKEKSFSFPIIIMSYLLFLIGTAFSYKLLLPFGVKFLIEFAPSNIHPMISIGNYISFASTLMLGTGVIFELPLLLIFLAFLGIIDSKKLKLYRKYAFLISFIIGAVITPSVDIMVQSLLAGALYILYEISIAVISLFERKNKTNEIQEN
ncbi:MAG: twin-arginine translocase subunit TatC [Candidatus Sericytochromatia bacterium]